MTDVVIVSAARTPIGAFNGALSSLPAHDLGKVAIAAALERAKVEAGEVDEVVLGQILTAGEGQNPARQAAIAAGIPQEKTAYGINQLCGSGLRAVALGYQAIRAGDQRHRRRRRPGEHEPGAALHPSAQRREDGQCRDGRHHDQGRAAGTPSTAITWATPPRTWRRNGRSPAPSRMPSPQSSQQKAEAAQKSGRFKDEIVPVTIATRKGDVIVDAGRVSPPWHDRGDCWASCARPS